MRGRHSLLALACLLAACGGGSGSGSGMSGGTATTPPPTPAPPPTPTPTPPAPRPASEWAGFVSLTVEQLCMLDPAFAVYQGRHDFDGRLPDWSEAGLQATIAFWQNALAQANAFTGLDPTQQFEKDYFVQFAQAQLFWLQDADMPHSDPAFYINGGLDPNVYLTRAYADLPTRMRAVTGFLQAVPTATLSIRANLRMPMPATFISYASATFHGYATYYSSDIRPVFASVNDPALQQQLSAAVTSATAAMNNLASYIDGNAASAIQNFALGGTRFAQMLATNEAVTTPIADLLALGQADLVRNQSALASACAAFAPGQSLTNCVNQVSAQVPPDGQIAAATRQIAELRDFVIANDLVTIPGNEQVIVRESPPYNRGNPAYIDPPGPYETGIPSIYYISPTAIINENDLLFASVHEAMPGHFVQFLASNRAPLLTERLFVFTGFAEGWAHYSEEMMWEAGLRGTPQAHIGQILEALLRNCRYLAAIQMHTQGMTVAQAQALFQQQCYQGPGTAAQQAARGTFDPDYLSYLLDKMMIRRLRADWTATRGGRAAWKAFHDQFLSYGGPPVPLVRAQMMGGSAAALF
jgi:uncharacterized protein (DUF885 family)